MLKGKACMNCRRRKIKCDGDKPSCGQCAKSNGTFEDCEYPGPGPTQVQLLEERISHVQDRIRKLESGAEPLQSALSNHSGTPSPHDVLLFSSPRTPPQRSLSSCSGSPRSSTSNVPSSPRNAHCHDSQCVEPPQEVIAILFDAFRRYSHHLGFFLNLDRFQESIFLPAAPGHYARPCPSLINAVYLWGAHFTASSHPLGLKEDVFLKKALHHLSSDLASSHPRKVLHVLQTEVLLSYYHLRNGKALGGNYHANAAVSLFLSSGFHNIFRAPWQNPDVTRCPSPSELAANPLAAGMVPGESCAMVSSILSLNAFWVTLEESHSMLYDMQDIGIDSPNAMDQQLKRLYNITSQTTIDLLGGPYIEKVSFISLLSSSALLLEEATNLHSSPTGPTKYTTSGLGNSPTSVSADAFTRLDSLIDAFKTYFPFLMQRVSTRAEQELFLVIQMATEAAIIKLHTPRALQGDLQSRSKSLYSAHTIALLMENATRDSTNGQTVAGLFCSAACDVLARELGAPDSLTMENKAQWSGVLTSLYSQMMHCSGSNTFMRFVVKRLAKTHPEFFSVESASHR